MTKDEHWAVLLLKNKAMRDGKDMTFAGYKKLHDQTWDRAQLEVNRDGNANPIFDQIFGRMR